MTKISKDDEREAREWANTVLQNSEVYNVDDAVAARTILALLDRPVMPHPADVPDEVWQTANDTFHRFAYTVPGIQAAYRVLYDHHHQPPAPVKVEAWGIAGDNGEIVATYRSRASAEKRLPICANGCRIVHLREVEAEHD